MRYFPLIWIGLWRKPARRVFTLLSITATFVLFGILMGLDAGFARAIDEARLDRILVFSRFGGQLPMAYQEQLEKIDGVTLVAPFTGLGGYYQDTKNSVFVVSRDQRSFRMWPEFPVTQAQEKILAQMRTGVIVSASLADKYHWKAGDRIPIQSQLVQQDGSKVWIFDVVAVVGDIPAVPRGYMLGNFTYLDEARSVGKGTVGFFGIRIQDSSQGSKISREIDDRFANGVVQTRTIPERTAFQNGLNSFVDIQFLTGAVIGATMFMLLFLTGNVMMQSVRERIPEFAVLKTIGFSDFGLLVLIVLEASIPCLLGALAGLAISRNAAPFAILILPPGLNLPVPDLSPTVFLSGFAVAILVAAASGIPPAWRVKRLNVVDALAGR
jgi:putative ABC transport system permease protein